jgi:hypothetical protein
VKIPREESREVGCLGLNEGHLRLFREGRSQEGTRPFAPRDKLLYETSQLARKFSCLVAARLLFARAHWSGPPATGCFPVLM